MKKLTGSLFTTASILATTMILPTEAADWNERIDLGGYIAQGWQSPIEVDGGRAVPSDANADSGFQRLRFALHTNIKLSDRVSIFAELAEEPNDFSGITKFGLSQDLAWIDTKLNDNLTFRVGNIIAYPGSLSFLRYSDGAVVQSNPLIGNSPVDMITAEQGAWLFGSHKFANDNKFAWDLTVSNPSFFGDFSEDSGYNLKANGTVLLGNGFGFGAGVFKTNGDANCVGGTCTLSDGGAVNSSIGLGDGDNYEFSTGGPATRSTHVAIIPGIDATITQLDAQYKKNNVLVHGYVGNAKDKYSYSGGFGTGQFTEKDAEMDYLGVLGQYNFNKKLYVAGRYTQSKNKSEGVSGNDELSRAQVGLGYWMSDASLLKVEYVKQTEEANSGGLKTNGLTEAEWDGISVEASYHF